MSLSFATTTLQNDMALALADAIDAGGANAIIHIYTTPIPATNASASGTLLATLTMSDPAFSVTAAVLTANPITPASAVGTGSAAYFRIESNGTDNVLTGNIGLVASGADLELNTLSILPGVQIDINSLVLTVGNE